MHGGIWTDAHIAFLKDRFDAGLSFREIAAELSKASFIEFTRNAVIGKAGRLGLLGTRAPKPAVPKKSPRPRTRVNVRAVLKPKPREQIKLLCASLDPLHLSFAELEPHHCHWPFGDGPYTFCGHPIQDDRPYCTAHVELGRLVLV